MVENVAPMARSGGSLYSYILIGLTCKCGFEHMHVQVETLVQTRSRPETDPGHTGGRLGTCSVAGPDQGQEQMPCWCVSVQLVVGHQ